MGKYEDPARRRRRRALRKLDAKIRAGKLTAPACAYPFCEGPRVSEDCCIDHSLDASGTPGFAFLQNDGIIDWEAVEILRRGERVVKATWVEVEIAAAKMLVDGLTQDEIRERTGINFRGGGSRIKKIQEVADALRAAA